MKRNLIAILLLVVFTHCSQPEGLRPTQPKTTFTSFFTGHEVDSSLLIPGLDFRLAGRFAEIIQLSGQKSLSDYDSQLAIRMFYAESWMPCKTILITSDFDSLKKTTVSIVEMHYIEMHSDSFLTQKKPPQTNGEIEAKSYRKFVANNIFCLDDTLKELIQQYDLQKSPVMDTYDGADGNEILLEILLENKYNVIYRWTPSLSKFPDARKVQAFATYLNKLPYLYLDTIFDYSKYR